LYLCYFENMKATIRNVKISEIPTAIEQLGLSAHACVDFTIENHEMTGNEQDETTQALMEVVNEIRAYAKSQGLTDEKLEELLVDES
jgi:hypothetical protein